LLTAPPTTTTTTTTTTTITTTTTTIIRTTTTTTTRRVAGRLIRKPTSRMGAVAIHHEPVAVRILGDSSGGSRLGRVAVVVVPVVALALE
ncbi:unnamed protein product, partial [Polarella glacialis]